MIYGYARVSTEGQRLDRQLDALSEYGCEFIYKEKMTGTKRNRKELSRMIEGLHEGDTVVITDLTRISRSTKDMLDIVDEVTKRGASIKSLKDTWLDTTSDNPYNTFLLTVMSGISQLERDLISCRVREGLEATKKRGTELGRRKLDMGQFDKARVMVEEGASVSEACRDVGISRSAYYKYLRLGN